MAVLAKQIDRPLRHQLYRYGIIPHRIARTLKKKSDQPRYIQNSTSNSSLIPALDRVKPVPGCRTPNTVTTLGRQFAVIMLS
ncbi:unnamed protein product [Tuber melanosporum]|uniref:(Perigord truffle) hypothetical protein n=1 Tax=Tuber melanosporum (strain Mel28) TaxID=656061 RepID=D5G9Z6_TUBMM|nr:uncharacterized protein GSTUM_00003469001 [Tuber melanosporum]CAZ81339.1 unnamed protein product [Tuber melanosporum]